MWKISHDADVVDGCSIWSKEEKEFWLHNYGSSRALRQRCPTGAGQRVIWYRVAWRVCSNKMWLTDRTIHLHEINSIFIYLIIFVWTICFFLIPRFSPLHQSLAQLVLLTWYIAARLHPCWSRKRVSYIKTRPWCKRGLRNLEPLNWARIENVWEMEWLYII